MRIAVRDYPEPMRLKVYNADGLGSIAHESQQPRKRVHKVSSSNADTGATLLYGRALELIVLLLRKGYS